MNTETQITEQQVYEFLQAKRRELSLDALAFTVYDAIPAKPGIHNGVPETYGVYAHRNGACRTGDSISDAVSKLSK